MAVTPEQYGVYLYCVGNGSYQAFIKNISADADFVRLMVGHTELLHGKRVSRVTYSVTISPLQPQNEHVHIDTLYKWNEVNRRTWVAFEAVKRGNGKKNYVVGTFMTLSPAPSKWRTRVGSLTDLNIRTINSLKSIDQAPDQQELAQMT